MLPKDTEKRHKEVLVNNQSRLDPHLREMPQKEAIIPYSDERFCDAAIEWLVSTDQVWASLSNLVLIHHMNHSLFKPLNTYHFRI